MKKLTSYMWALVALLIVFFTVGAFTLGTTETAGQSLLVKADSPIYLSLTVENNEMLGSVYVNVGDIHTDPQRETTITVRTNTSGTPATSSSFTTAKDLTLTLSNLTTQKEEGKVSNYNWIQIGSDVAKPKTVKTIEIKATSNIVIREVVCFDTNGNRMEITGYRGVKGNKYTEEELACLYDAQDAYNAEAGAYYNFTEEEAYYLASVNNLQGDATYDKDSVYLLAKNHNYLATVLLSGSVSVFGESVFAVRFPSLVATTLLILFAALLIKEVTKSDKVAFLTALLVCVGGLATTVGRLGAPYAMVASALIASAYFMYRFYSKGISSRKVLTGGLNVFVSGVFAAFAMAIDASALLPTLAILVLFGFGLRRQKIAYKLALEKTSDKEETEINANGETVIVNRAAEKVKRQYEDKVRICFGYAALSFVMMTAVLLLLSAISCYTAFIRSNGNVDEGFIVTVWRGLRYSVRSGCFTAFAQNDGGVLSWLLPIGPATLYTASTDGYLAWNALPNLIASFAALAAFVAVTAKVVLGFVHKTTSKKELRIRRTYFLILGGMFAFALTGVLKAQASCVYALGFQALYLAFIPVLLLLIPESWTKGKKLAAEIGVWVLVVLAAAVFFMSLPSAYGVATSASGAKWFQWTSLGNNGLFK